MTNIPVRAAAIVLLLFGGGFALEARRYPFGSPNAPGAGFLPLVLGVIFALLALLLLVRPGQPLAGSVLPADRQAAVRIATTVLGLAAAIALLEHLGFLVVGTLLMLVLLLFLDRRPIRAAILAPGVTLFAYVVFKIWLKVPLPSGVLSF